MLTTQQHVILPNAPLLLVNKSCRTASQAQTDWQSHVDLPKDSTLFAKTNIELVAPKTTAIAASNDQTTRRQNKTQPAKDSRKARVFEFINLTARPPTNDPDIQRLVKSHVKRGILRGRNASKTPEGKTTTRSDSGKASGGKQESVGEATTPKLGPVCAGSAVPWYGHAVDAILSKPRSQSLLSYYLEVVALLFYPLEAFLMYNPVKSGWLSLAMTDEFLLRSVLFSSASRLAVENACPDPDEPSFLVEPVLRQLNQRLQHFVGLSDSTVAIVACLAMVEVAVGAYDKWRIHMMALKEMALLCGGLNTINEVLQCKICRADIEGATDSLSAPYLPPLPRTRYSTFSVLSPSSPTVTLPPLISNLEICPALSSMFFALSCITRTINHTLCYPTAGPLDPRVLDEDFSLLLHQLLSWQPSRPSTRDEALRLGAILYAKSLTRPFRAIPRNTRPIVHHFISALDELFGIRQRHQEENDRDEMGSYIWLLLVGAVSVRIDSKERVWFATELAKLQIATSHEKLTDWNGSGIMLEKMLWVPSIHEAPWQKIWEEAEAMEQ